MDHKFDKSSLKIYL